MINLVMPVWTVRALEVLRAVLAAGLILILKISLTLFLEAGLALAIRQRGQEPVRRVARICVTG